MGANCGVGLIHLCQKINLLDCIQSVPEFVTVVDARRHLPYSGLKLAGSGKTSVVAWRIRLIHIIGGSHD